ncbi:MAG: hypothetical protein PWR04_13 [Anaerophaga sp.]|nr:hypothetical protein [Anaerophaga sp.]
MPVSVGFRAFRPASGFISWDTEAAPHSGTFHTRGRYTQVEKKPTTQQIDNENGILNLE